MAPEQDLPPSPTLGPFLAAFICEKLLEERDGIKTAVRIIDQLNRQAVGSNPPSLMDPFVYPLSLVVRLKAGAARGTFPITVRIVKPNNEKAAELNNSVHLPGPDDAGVDFVLNMMLEINEVGTWWFDIYVRDERWMRVPLRVVYLPQSVRQPGAPGGL